MRERIFIIMTPEENSISEKETMASGRRSLITVSLIVTCIASSFLQTALTTALPPMIADLGISVSQGQWLTSGYSLAMGIMMPLTAFMITRYPARKLYLWAIGIFLAGLAVCIFAADFYMMMAGRIMQACSNGITTSMAQVVLLTIYPPDRRGSVMGWYGLSVGAAPVIAPALAGVLVDTLGWRTIFIIAFGVLMISFIMAAIVFDDCLETKIRKFDRYSFVLSIVAFGGITLGIGNLSSEGIRSLSALCPLTAGLLAGIVFARRQLASDEPFLDLRILRSHGYALSVAGSMMLYFVMMGSSVIMPLYIQTVLGRSATVSGLVTLPGSLAMAIVSPFAGKIYDRFGMKRLAVTGSLLMLLSTAGMCVIGMDTSILIPALLNVIRCIAIGCLMMPFVTFGIASLKPGNTAHGTALLTSLRTIAGAIGTAVFVGILNVSSASAELRGLAAPGMHGIHMTFGCMSISGILLVAVMIYGTRKHRKDI